MKKCFQRWILCALALIVPTLSAHAEVTLTGTLQPEAVKVITAPFSGIVTDCPVRAGTSVEAGEELFALDTVKVYAPADGIICALRAKEGDNLQDVSALYGAAMYVEPNSPYIINATTSGAYDANENRVIHVGERVFLTSVNNSDRTATGRITSVSGESYTVEVLDGNLHLNETCRISRKADSSKRDGRIGQGKTERNNPIPVSATGSLIRLHVKEYNVVKRGDLLMELAPDVPDGETNGIVTMSEAGVITQLNVSACTAVQKGQPMALWFPAGTLQAAVAVTEDDLPLIQVGDAVRVELDLDPEQYHYDGVIEAISYVANEAGTYEVWVSFENDDFVRQGMTVTVDTLE